MLPLTRSRFAVDYTPSCTEQRRITIIVRNIRRHAAWRLKKAALDYSKVHTSWTPSTIILAQASIHGGR